MGNLLVVVVLALLGVSVWQTWDHWRVMLGLGSARDGRRFRHMPQGYSPAPYDEAAADGLDWELRDRIRTALEIEDPATWAALEPKVRAVVRLQRQLPEGAGRTPLPAPGSQPNQGTDDASIAAIREQRSALRDELKRAQTDLRISVTRRQEAALVLLGILD